MKAARHLSAMKYPAILLLGILLCSSGVSAITTWNETATDFPSGQNINTGVENGSLALDFNQSLLNNWTKVGDVSSPGPRYRHSMVYDPADGVHILFGGLYLDTNLDDTWTYNMSQNRWTARSTLTFPTAKVGCSMAFDTRYGVAVLFAGSLDGAYTYTEFYDITKDAWVNKNPPISPVARGLQSMAFDPASGRIVLFGGRHPTSPSGTDFACFGDTWTYELSSNSWTNRTSGSAPSPRCGQSMTYDPASGLIVLFGGMNETTVFRDTWTYNTSTNIWTYCSLPSMPPARHGAAMASDAKGGTVIIYGGQGQMGMLEDKWSYNVTANAWTSKALGNQPSPRGGAAMTYDAQAGKMFFFGGQLDQSQGWDAMDDYGSYDPATNNWAKLGELAAPMPRFSPAAAFDSKRGSGILFGGSTDHFLFGDTWTYDLSVNRWSRLHPKFSPPGRYDASMCYDSDDDVVVLFGGLTHQGPGFLADTWLYNVSRNNWTQWQSPPSAATGIGCMAYDPESRLVVYFGGGVPSGNQTWTYNVTANLWTLRNPPVCPPARSGSIMVYDQASRQELLFGGFNGTGALADTWAYNASTSNWTRRSPLSSPAARYDHAMAYNSEIGASLIFGGTSSIGQTPFGDTWVYSSTTDNWTNIVPAAAPSPRTGACMYYDLNVKATVLFGGAVSDSSGFKADTWLFGLPGRYSSGTYTSAPKDTGGKAYFGSLSWQSSVPSNTSVKFQFRSGSSPADMEGRGFFGPDGTVDTYFAESGQMIPSIHNGSRWMQYRAYLSTYDLLKTPSVPSVTVECNLLHTAALDSPVAGNNWTGRRWINWTAADPDGDPLLVDIYLVNETGTKAPLAVSIPAGDGSWLWDTSSAPNGSYRISLLARDGSPSIPLSVQTVSGTFTVFHNGTGPPPGPNDPPLVFMRSPVDGASLVLKPPASVSLEWNGSDPDGDALVYNVYLSAIKFNLSNLPPPAAQTAGSNFSAPGLGDNTTYYWTITASDGQAVTNGTVWEFYVKHGIPNIPPRITSIPPANATIGSELVYMVTAVDEDSGNISFSLTSNVPGMSIAPVSGRLNWTPKAGQTGDFSVAIKVSDGQGGYAEQKFIILVGEPPVSKPVCSILSPHNRTIVGGIFWVNGTAVNGSFGIVRLQIRIDQRGWQEAGRTAGNWSVKLDTRKTPNGAHVLEARAFDGRNYSDPVTVGINFRNPEKNITVGGNPMGTLVFPLFLAAALFLGWQLLGRKGGPAPPKEDQRVPVEQPHRP